MERLQLILHVLFALLSNFAHDTNTKTYCPVNLTKSSLINKLNERSRILFGQFYQQQKDAYLPYIQGYRRKHLSTFYPICPGGCQPDEDCVRPNECGCKEGYARHDLDTSCQPLCSEDCEENAHCTEPNVCSCAVGFIEVGGLCKSICSEAYWWNATSGDCARRCKLGIVWDTETQTCVQKLQVHVELISEEVNQLGPALDETQTEVVDVRVANAPPDSCDADDTNCMLLAKQEPANETVGNTSSTHTLLVWTKVISILILAGVLLIVVVLRFMRFYCSHGSVAAETTLLAEKHDLHGEYVLDRSRIMVY